MTQLTPPSGEKSKNQSVAFSFCEPLGFGSIPASTYSFYRKALRDPTVALAFRASVTRPTTANWIYKSNDKAPPEALDLIKEWTYKLQSHFIRNCVDAVAFGWQPFEKVFEIQSKYRIIKKFKPLAQEITEIKVRKDGSYNGLTADDGKTRLTAPKSFVFTYNGRAGNLYGDSRLNNIKEDLHAMWDMRRKQGIYIQRVASPTPVLYHPDGVSINDNGAEVSNTEIAANILQKLQTGYGLSMTDELVPWAADMIDAGVDIAKLRTWQLQMFEPTSTHGSDFVEMRRHSESLVARGMLMTERALLEGSSGTKAEAGIHATVSMQASEYLTKDIFWHINNFWINDLLKYNWGWDAKDTVWVEPEPLHDETRIFWEKVMMLMVGPATAEWASTWMDVQEMANRLGIPITEEPPVINTKIDNNGTQKDSTGVLPNGEPLDSRINEE